MHRIWKEAGLKPHRLERHLASDDPEFETRATEIIGLKLRLSDTQPYSSPTKRCS